MSQCELCANTIKQTFNKNVADNTYGVTELQFPDLASLSNFHYVIKFQLCNQILIMPSNFKQKMKATLENVANNIFISVTSVRKPRLSLERFVFLTE